MVKTLKLPQKRVEDDPTFTPDEQKLIREVFEDAIRIGLVKIKK